MIWAIMSIKQADKVSGLLGSVQQTLAKLACKLKGSARPHLQAAVSKIGYLGYTRRTRDNGLAYFTNDGELLIDQDTLNRWWAGSGAFQRMIDAGVDPCFLKKEPPSEIFQAKTDKLYDGFSVVTIRGIGVRVDKNGYNTAAISDTAAAQYFSATSPIDGTDTNKTESVSYAGMLVAAVVLVGFYLFAKK